MSNAVSALPDAKFQGIAAIAEAGLHGMITIRGDFSSKKFSDALKSVVGCGVPEIRKIIDGHDGRQVAWMSPDELLLLTAYETVTADVDALNAALGEEHALVVNVSDARAVFTITGDHAREVIAKIAPVDLSVDAFAKGDFRRTRFAQVPAAFWLVDANAFKVVCFRSVAQYMFDLLSTTAQPGSEVGIYN